MKTRILPIVSASLVFLLAATGRLLGQTPASPARVAIISESDGLSAVADLLTVELSVKPQLQVLERAQIQKVYREQQLSAVNRDYVKLGQVLGADGLLLMGMVGEGTNNFVSVRLVAVKPGVAIGSVRTPWPIPDAPGWARWVANRLAPLLPKLTVPASNAVPISVVNLRSAVRSQAAQELERQLTPLVIERLTRERELFVLERQRMDLLNSEKELQGMGESAFWSGSYLLDGLIDRDGYSMETVTINARLLRPEGGGAVPIEFHGSRTNLASVVNQLVGKIMQGLERSPRSEPWSPAGEAQKYFEEAQWLFRWRMLKEAQAACESSWALGKQTREVADLRIRTYREQSVFPQNDWAAMNPRSAAYAPEIDKLYSAIIALQLYQQTFRNMLTKESEADPSYFTLGLDVLSSTADLLRRSYYHPEVCHECKEPLAEARSLCRETVAMLENHPRYRTLPPPRHRMFLYGDRNLFLEDAPSLGKIELGVGSFWWETPEECLGAYRKLARSGDIHGLRTYYAYATIIGWKSEDRQRIPRIWHEFVQELCASTNALMKVEGYYLALAEATPDQVYLEKEQQLFRIALENASALATARLSESLVADIADILADPPKRSEIQAQMYRLFATFKADFQQAIVNAESQNKLATMKAYLHAETPYEDSQFRKVFTTRSFSESEARELLPLIRDYAAKMIEGQGQRIDSTPQRPSGNTNGLSAYRVGTANRLPDALTDVERSLSERASPRPNVSIPRPDTLRPSTSPASQLMVSNLVRVTRLWIMPKEWILDASWGVPDITIAGMRFREGRLWLEVFNGANGTHLHKAFIFGVDLATFQTEVINLPLAKGVLDNGNRRVELSSAGDSFEVLGEYVYVNGGEGIQRYSLRTKTWEALAVPVAGHSSFSTVDGRLFITTEDSILELAADQTAVQILASTRRRPAQNILDSLVGFATNSGLDYSMLGSGHALPTVFQGPGQSVRTLIQGRIYAWNATKTGWSEILTLPEARGGMAYASFEGGMVLRCRFDNQKTSWQLLGKEGSSLETLLTESDSRPTRSGDRSTPQLPHAPNVSKPRWLAPMNMALSGSPFWLDDESLCFFMGDVRMETLANGQALLLEHGGYHASVVRFEKQKAEPLVIPLWFDLKDGFIPREEVRKFGGISEQTSAGWRRVYIPGPVMLAITPQGAVVTARNLPGFWLVPSTELQSPLGKQNPNELLLAAAQGGDLASVKQMLAQGAAVDARNYRGLTSLMIAAKAGNLELVKLLVAHGADVNAKSSSTVGSTVLAFAVSSNDPEIIEMLLDHGAGLKSPPGESGTPLYFAAANGLREAVLVLLSRGEDVNEPGKYDGQSFYTPLMGAACLGQVGMMELLLAKGAELERRNDRGSTALMEASKFPNPAGLKLLLAKGANVNATGLRGHTALIYAAYNAQAQNVKLLLEAGADPYATATDDDAPNAQRHDAAHFANPEIFKLITEAKAKTTPSAVEPSPSH